MNPHVVPMLSDPSFNFCALAVSGLLLIPIIRAVSAGPVGGPPAHTELPKDQRGLVASWLDDRYGRTAGTRVPGC
jgi:hypothetical protein